MDATPALSGLAVIIASLGGAAALFRIDAPASDHSLEWWESGTRPEQADTAGETDADPA